MGWLKFSVVIFAFIATSCVKERCCSCESPSGKESSMLMVSFGCEFEAIKATKSESHPLPHGIKTTIYAYSSGEDPLSRSPYPGTPVTAVSDRSGGLAITDQELLFLPYGEYDFYSVSANCSTMRGVSFTEGLSTPLNNGDDYLWAGRKEVEIKSNTQLILRFRHSQALISITISKGEQADSIGIIRALLYPPQKGGRMRLSTGEIGAAQSTEKQGVSLIRHSDPERVVLNYIILPLAEGIPLMVELETDIFYWGGKVINESRVGTLPMPKGGYRAGYRYNYKASVADKELIFNAATVNEWVYEAPFNIEIRE